MTTRTMTDQQINESAKFYPGQQAADDTELTYHPCIELGGDEHGDGAMQVYVYAEDGILFVSLHFGTTGPTGDDGSGPWAYYGPDSAIPVMILGDTIDPLWQATATANPRGLPLATAVHQSYQNGWDDRGNFRGPQS